MQSTTSQKHTDLRMWWPSPEAFDDLVVEDAEHGFDLSAPDATECGEWLSFWNQDEEHHTFFEQEFIQVLKNYAESILEHHGQTEAIADEQDCNRPETQEDSAGSVS